MEKIFEQIPDIWFDIYARLIPGVCFVLAVAFLFFSAQPSGQLLFVLLLSYIVGHIVQPAASAVARILEYRIFDRSGNIKGCRSSFDAGSRESRLLSKQHAECVCFVSLSILTTLILVAMSLESLSARCSYCGGAANGISWALLFYFVVCSFLRAHAVADRAKNYQADARPKHATRKA